MTISLSKPDKTLLDTLWDEINNGINVNHFSSMLGKRWREILQEKIYLLENNIFYDGNGMPYLVWQIVLKHKNGNYWYLDNYDREVRKGLTLDEALCYLK